MRVALAHGNLRAEARAALPGEVPARAFGIRRTTHTDPSGRDGGPP
jgi:hypothetical protein